MSRLARPFILALTLAGAGTLHAEAAPNLVIDAATGAVLVAEEATRPWNPASTTKMMTAYVALRAVKAGRLSLETPLIASATAARQRPSKIGIRPGQEITLDNALKIMMVRSANDLAVVIAEAIGGSIPGFSQLMNQEARRLGMTETRFLNPHGFHESGHQTSARDLAILARAMLVEMPEYGEYWGIHSVQLGNRLLNNTNGLIGRYPGASGLKTGFVCASGFNLVATAERGGRTLIAVVLGASSGGDRTVRAAQLLDQAFGTWNSTGQTVQTLPSSGYASAPDMRQEICVNRRRGVVLADDSDYGGSILTDTFSGDSMGSASATAFFAIQNGAPQPRAYSGVRVTGGRAVLGPRVATAPIPVFLGRAPGSTAVALGPGGRAAMAPATASAAALPASASALVSTTARTGVPGLDRPSAAAGLRPAGQNRPRPLDDEPQAGAPLQLPGVINSGSQRPAAAAGLRTRQAATQTTSTQPPSTPEARKRQATAKERQETLNKQKQKQAQAAKARSAPKPPPPAPRRPARADD